MLLLRAILKLIRLSSSLLGALAVFVGLMARTKRLGISVAYAVPLLFIGMCTFIANDLEDLEKDQFIHPERPLPSKDITPELAAILYFMSLGLALILTRHFVAQDIAFWYYGLAIMSISYVYVIDGLPSLKTIYVAAASCVPILIVARSYPSEVKLYVVAGSVFLLSLGREICGDIQDRKGDTPCFIHRFKPSSLAIIAFCFNGLALVLLALIVRNIREITDVLVMSLMLAVAGLYWFKLRLYKRATMVMKVQLFVGLYLLL